MSSQSPSPASFFAGSDIEQSPSAPQGNPVRALRLAHYGKTCPVIGQGIRQSKVKTKTTTDIHVVLTREALAKVDKEEMIEAKFEFTRPEPPEPKRIVREASPAPLRFSLANLLPVGV